MIGRTPFRSSLSRPAFYRRCGFVEYDRRAGNVYMALNLARN
jgi:hypothetical protein